MKKRFYKNNLVVIEDDVDVWMDEDDVYSLSKMHLPGVVYGGSIKHDMEGVYADPSASNQWNAVLIDADYYDSIFAGLNWANQTKYRDAFYDLNKKINKAYKLIGEYFY